MAPSLIQADTAKNEPIIFGINYGFGFFSPADINDYLDDFLDDQGAIMTTGIQNMFMNYIIGASLSYPLNTSLSIKGEIDYTFSLKTMKIDGGTDGDFSFNRIL